MSEEGIVRRSRRTAAKIASKKISALLSPNPKSKQVNGVSPKKSSALDKTPTELEEKENDDEEKPVFVPRWRGAVLVLMGVCLLFLGEERVTNLTTFIPMSLSDCVGLLAPYRSGSAVADAAALIFLAFGLITFPILLFVDAPYGGSYTPSWGPSMKAKHGWCLMEAPAVFVFGGMSLLAFSEGGFELNRQTALRIALFVMWETHYCFRAFVYPFVQSGKEKPMGLLVVAFAFFWTSANGWLNGLHIFHLHHHPALDSPAECARTIAGIILFWVGLAINRQSDRLLMALRKPNETAYKMPRGGLFEYVTKANYFGEIVEWCGFALASWNVPGLLFVVNTLANLVPRATRAHARHQERFKNYPANRRAIIPFLL